VIGLGCYSCDLDENSSTFLFFNAFEFRLCHNCLSHRLTKELVSERS
jgi:hypothetical protein